MTGTKKSGWESWTDKFKDLVFVIMFLITIGGWITTSVANKTKMKIAMDQNTEAVNELKTEIKKINEYITKQSELNGQIIQFMKDEK